MEQRLAKRAGGGIMLMAVPMTGTLAVALAQAGLAI
jgi:hypothetical protein